MRAVKGLVYFLVIAFCGVLNAQYIPSGDQYSYPEFAKQKVKVYFANENQIQYIGKDGRIRSSRNYLAAAPGDTNWLNTLTYVYNLDKQIAEVQCEVHDSINAFDCRNEKYSYNGAGQLSKVEVQYYSGIRERIHYSYDSLGRKDTVIIYGTPIRPFFGMSEEDTFLIKKKAFAFEYSEDSRKVVRENFYKVRMGNKEYERSTYDTNNRIIFKEKFGPVLKTYGYQKLDIFTVVNYSYVEGKLVEEHALSTYDGQVIEDNITRYYYNDKGLSVKNRQRAKNISSGVLRLENDFTFQSSYQYYP